MMSSGPFLKTQLLKEHPYDETMRSTADWKFFMHELVCRNVSFRQLFMAVEQIPPVRKLVYRVNVFLLNVLNLWLRSGWIKKLKYSKDEIR